MSGRFFYSLITVSLLGCYSVGIATRQLGYSYTTGLTEEQVMSKTVLLFLLSHLCSSSNFLRLQLGKAGFIEFLEQEKIGERNKLLPMGWFRSRRHGGIGREKNLFFFFSIHTLPASILHGGPISCYYMCYIEIARFPQ